MLALRRKSTCQSGLVRDRSFFHLSTSTCGRQLLARQNSRHMSWTIRGCVTSTTDSRTNWAAVICPQAEPHQLPKYQVRFCWLGLLARATRASKSVQLRPAHAAAHLTRDFLPNLRVGHAAGSELHSRSPLFFFCLSVAVVFFFLSAFPWEHTVRLSTRSVRRGT